jgi:short coiled-coil protein
MWMTNRDVEKMQASLSELCKRIESVTEKYDELDKHNNVLQKHVGDLIARTKITATKK